VNPFDIVTILLVVFALILGFRSGALPQVGGLIGAIGGGAGVVLALPALGDVLTSIDPSIRPIVVMVGLVLAVIAGESIGSAIGRVVARRLGTGVLGAADRVAGSVVGVGQALLIVWLLGGLLAIGPLPRLNDTARESTAVRSLNAILPPPDEIAVELGLLIDASGLPEVFIGFDPVPRPPVALPEDGAAHDIAMRAIASTFRIEAATCAYRSSGSGVVVANQVILTNAHVVAGATAVAVFDLAGVRSDARVILFDPDLDIALLRADGVRAPVLVFARTDPKRSDIGVVLGYPGGGGLAILPAAVAGAYPATGLDIYDAGPVRRDLLELHAQIDRGDSGAPFVLVDGTIGGLVFAEARTDPEVGYALAATSVARRIAGTLDRLDTVDTGACLR
jgi:S1-C subfamily serine protease